MQLAGKASRVSEFKTFPPDSLACLEEQPAGAISGVSKDGRNCWGVRGCHLEVLDTSTGDRKAAWQFGKLTGDAHTRVTCVKEMCPHVGAIGGGALKLLVGVCDASPTGLLCLFDVASAKVVKAIEVPYPVTEVEVVSIHSQSVAPRWALSEHLTYFIGLVAVGTNTGHIILVDLCLDDQEFYSDEELPSHLHMISPRVRDIENQRFHCMSQGLHLAMDINETMFTRSGFEYQKPDGLVMKTFRPDMVAVTCLRYTPQAGLLIVGFNFGCFQLWKLHVPVLEYSSRLESEPLPISHITYQEPENDPKNFCYIWVARGQPEMDDGGYDPSVSSIALYQLAFNHKAFYSNYGVFYDGLASVGLRMEHNLTANLVQTGSNFEGSSKVISCSNMSDPFYQPPAVQQKDESFEEAGQGPDLSLCMFVWETTDGQSHVGRYLAVFDINRWYQAQMPASVRYVSGLQDVCAYFSWCKLDSAVEKASNDTLVAAHVSADRLRRFDSSLPMPPEQHFYPSALAFDTLLVFETGVLSARYLGSQRQILCHMEMQGPGVLVLPQELHSTCIHVGLLPRPASIVAVHPTLAAQREALFSVALEYNLVNFIKTCIAQWADGEYEHQGCTLKSVLDWTWDTVSKLKHQIDTLSAPLYNWSGLTLDERAVQTLVQCNQKLANLICVLKVFVSQTGPISVAGEAELNSKILVTSLINQHLSVVMWFFSVGLLPENDDTEVTLGGQYCYPATSLMSAYKSRREELAGIHVDVGETDLLLIDGLVEHIGVKSVWDREGGTGLYPPPSLHALLSCYLLESSDVLSKHCLVLYVLLDLVSVDSSAEDENFSEKVNGFAKRFHLPATLVKLIQAFWLLDHRDFEESLKLLLDPMVRTEFSRWQHRRIIKSLLYQGDARMALRYISTLKPALTTPEDVKLKLTVLLANGMIESALDYQRKCRDKTNMQDLLAHLFLGCQQTKTVDRLLQLPLTELEESSLVSHLMSSSEPHSQELLVMHYLQRARFVEAVQLNERLKHSIMTEGCPKARERASARNAIVEKYASVLPSVQRRLLFEQTHVPKKNTQWRREIRRPTPLSTKLTHRQSKVTSQSTYIMTIMETLDEIEDNKNDETKPLDRSAGPFVCTPVTPARRSLRDTPVTVYLEDDGNDASGLFSLNRSISMLHGPDTGTPDRTFARNTTRYVSASCLTLLQTPTVRKVTPRKSRPSLSQAITPQSILKVRNMISTTSPSPHSGGTTPNSLETEGSARKFPRKLGYSGSTPLSSLPRHLMSQTGSAPASPKSVSFIEPADEAVISVTPKQTARSSKPSTPKSVSFADTPFSTVTKLKPLSTPKAQKSGGQRSPISKSPGSPRSLRDRSPTPESMEKSPRHASHVDRLQRLPLHEDLSPDAAVRHDGRSGVTEDSDLKLRLEESDENISDEDVEEMEGSFMSPATSPASADLSHVSMATVRELALTTSTSPDISQMEPSTSISPRKSPSSPTVKISKSHVSEFAAKNSTDSTENTQEHVQSATTSTEHVQTGSLNFGKLKTSEEPVSIDLTESNDEMEVEESENEGKVEQTGEIFKDYEEIHPPGGIEEEPMEDTISEVGDIVDENVAQEKVNAHIEQEVENEVAKVEVVVDEDIVFKTPVKQEPVEEEEDNSKTGSNVQQTSPGLVVFDKQLQRKSLTPPSERNIPLIKKKDSPPDSEYGVQSPEVHGQNVAHILEEIDNRFADTPVKEEEEDVKRNIKTEAQGKPRARRKFEIGTDVNEADVEEMSETVENIDDNVEQVVSSTVTVAEPESSVQEPTTPTRSSRRLHRNDKSPEKASGSLEEPVTPSRSTRGRKKKDEGEVTQEETVTPTRSTRRQSRELASPSREGAVSSTRSLHRQARIEKIKDNLVAIEAKSRKPFSQEAKEAVQESLLQISEELRDKDKEDEVDDDTMTKIKDKIVESPPRTPIRGRKKAETSTRSSTRHKKSDEDSGGNDENIPVTPTRTRRGTKQTSSPKSEVKTKATTPRRGRKKADTGSDDDKSNNNAIELGPVEGVSFTEPLTVKGANTAVNVEINDSFGHSVIPEDVEVDDATPGTPSRRSLSRSCKKHVDENDVPKTPTRRQSLRRGNKTDDIDVDLPRTPTRRSLGRAVKAQLVEEENVPKTPTRRQSVGRGQKVDNDETEAPKTPTRQQSVGRGQKAENDETEVPKTPTRRQSVGRGQKAENDEAEAPKTPTRRQSLGRSGKSQVEEENVPKTPTRRQSAGRPRKQGETAFDNEEKGKATTPSRGRGKKYVDMEVTETEKLDEGDIDNKQDTKKATPSRRGRPKKTDSSPEKDVAIAELEKPVTPSRRGRPKKTDASSEKVEKVTTPSRRGHKKDVKSDSEEEVKEDGTPVEKMTPSRRKKTKTEATPAARTRSHDQEIEETDMPSLQPDLYDIQPSGFQFSDPMHVASSEDIQPPKAFTPVKSFIFSPPVNHTRPMRGVELEQAPPILLPEQTHPPEEEAKDKGKKTTVKRKKKLYKEQDELLLISPASVTTASPSEEGRGVVTRETRARKAQTKKDGTKIVVQGIEKALRGRKSSYRMGPVTKKK
ncbi:protein ELYS-like [Mya arenaria]|uniref:protein ELYS-like n=1 Tax=Mya arenaria TaxID=6604 RepID=UPI0022DEF329|nr:protein ELYS-like [Mya arenaria]